MREERDPDGSDEPETESGPDGERTREDPEPEERGAAVGSRSNDAVDSSFAFDDTLVSSDDVPVTSDDREAPLSGIADRLDRGSGADGERPAAPSPDGEGLFERENVDEIDGERVWKHLVDGPPPGEGTTEIRHVREVSKRQFCHQCEHFASPPAVGCTNEGTDILEMPSMDTFRVAGCPVVREEDALNERS